MPCGRLPAACGGENRRWNSAVTASGGTDYPKNSKKMGSGAPKGPSREPKNFVAVAKISVAEMKFSVAEKKFISATEFFATPVAVTRAHNGGGPPRSRFPETTAEPAFSVGKTSPAGVKYPPVRKE